MYKYVIFNHLHFLQAILGRCSSIVYDSFYFFFLLFSLHTCLDLLWFFFWQDGLNLLYWLDWPNVVARFFYFIYVMFVTLSYSIIVLFYDHCVYKYVILGRRHFLQTIFGWYCSIVYDSFSFSFLLFTHVLIFFVFLQDIWTQLTLLFRSVKCCSSVIYWCNIC